MDIPFAHANSALLAILKDYVHLMEQSLPLGSDDLRSRVRAILFKAIPDRRMGMAQTAASIYMSVSTLRRRLRQSGTNYRALLDEVRAEMAAGHLGDRKTRAEVANMLGFSEPSAYQRAVKRWSGRRSVAQRSDA